MLIYFLAILEVYEGNLDLTGLGILFNHYILYTEVIESVTHLMDLVEGVKGLNKNFKNLLWQGRALNILPQREFIFWHYVISVQHVLLLGQGFPIIENKHAVVIDLRKFKLTT